ncbi:MAG: hypothetical protein WB788_00610 [Thermoplasmata archaeon]
MASATKPTFDLAALGRGRYGTFLWGESRPALNRVLFAMVRASDPEPLWLDLRPREREEGEPGPVELGWIPEDHLFLAEAPESARPQDAVANMALFTIVRPDESAASIARLSDFVRLPPIAQEIISRLGLGEPRHALAIANSDRVRSVYPSTVEGVRPIVNSFLEAPLLPFFASKGTPGPGRMAFEFVFELRVKDVAHWREGSLFPEKSPTESGVRVGVPIPLTQISGLAAAFAPAPDRKQSP